MDIKDFSVYCINLDERTDRWEESKNEFLKVHLRNVYRYSAIRNANPVIGCILSHMRVLSECKEQNKHAMIFEDDVMFINNYQDMYAYLNTLDGTNWDMLYFGGNICGAIQPVNSYLGRLTHCQSTHAYCVNKKCIDTILNSERLLTKPMDLTYAEDIIPHNNCFITIPMLAIQRPSYSDIEKKMVDYSWMEERYERNKGW